MLSCLKRLRVGIVMRLETQEEGCGVIMHVAIAHYDAHRPFLCIMHPLSCWFILYLLKSSLSRNSLDPHFQEGSADTNRLIQGCFTATVTPEDLNRAFRRASTLPLCNELLSSFSFLCTVCTVCKVCRLAVDFLHIRSHPHQLVMSETQATQAGQCPNVFGRLLQGQQWNTQSPDTVSFPVCSSPDWLSLHITFKYLCCHDTLWTFG